MSTDPLLFGVSRRQEAGIADQILDVFRDVIFDAILKLFTQKNAQAKRNRVLSNAEGDALRAALRSGRVQYEAGVFSGSFSAAISRDILSMGATFQKVSSVYKMPIAKVPAWVTAEASSYKSQARTFHTEMASALDQAHSTLDHALEAQHVDAGDVIDSLEEGWRGAAKKLEVNPELSEGARDRLRMSYDDNLKLSIRKFADEEIPVLRQIVRENAFQGYRADRLMKAIEMRYDVTKNKAKFLAEHETSLLVSKFREQRFRETVGDRYIWMTSHDIKVRHDHRDLDGKEFSYNSPPITNKTTGAKNNPGEDYRCRCVARPKIGPSRPRLQNQAPETATLYIVRHGSTELNEEHKLRGWLDVPLSDTGRQQARETAVAIAEATAVDAVYASDLKRARETGTIIADMCKAPIIISAALRPVNFGDYQGQPSEVVDPKIEELYRQWADNPDVPAPGGESFREFQDRNLGEIGILREALKPGKVLVLVTHYRNCAWFDAYVENGNAALVGASVKKMLGPAQGLATYSVFTYTIFERQFRLTRFSVGEHLTKETE